MSARQIRKQGFTLVEILIVVVILGILAAIVIPQFTSASETAKASSLISQLQTIRSQLELYQVQHQGNYPVLTGTDGDGEFWEQLTKFSNSDGDLYDSKAAALTAGETAVYGPYMSKAPNNSFVSTVDSTKVAAATAADTAWEYDENSGKIRAIIPSGKWNSLEDLGLGTSDDITAGSNADVVKAP